MSNLDPNAKINLSKVAVMVIESSAHALDVTSQILKGFGVSAISRFDKIADAEKHLSHRKVDLIVIDPRVGDGAGYQFISSLRHSGGRSAYVPVLLVAGHLRKSDIARGRDTGANFIVSKPLSPTTLLQRLMWVARDKRPFVEVGKYIGPDRRFKYEGPPDGSDGRRNSDLRTPLGEASEPNLSQDEVDAMIKPQRVML
ncbi:response regulator [Candidatus Viadribacter manganicus]|uniref:Response regulatory domain-containing protein n=1 Tax=Candidatus Viadribacter manganicus TaxID=1759059 RepID=A0A1B1AGK2_9PROT|nr:response regulator [Candidatus Viadribacter manganicus]ANP45671.1 hypothetical protein ATE48_06920 [Candidatus Viadribacter manganicus]